MAKADPGYLFVNITGTGNTLVKTGGGKMGMVIINRPTASAVITIYDGLSASGVKIGTITIPATLLAQGPIQAEYEVAFSTGLFVTVATGACDITITYA